MPDAKREEAASTAAAAQDVAEGKDPTTVAIANLEKEAGLEYLGRYSRVEG